jgi:hypothetical protein
MNIIQGDYPARKAPQGRSRSVNGQEPSVRRDGTEKDSAAASGGETPSVTAAKIRARLVELQRSVSRHQRLLGGLYGLRDLLQAEPHASSEQLDNRIASVVAAGKTLPETIQKELLTLESGMNRQTLDKVIGFTEQAIVYLSTSLGKTEIADQNARSLAARDSLAEVARGLRAEGSLPQRLSREQVLKLLG